MLVPIIHVGKRNRISFGSVRDDFLFFLLPLVLSLDDSLLMIYDLHIFMIISPFSSPPLELQFSNDACAKQEI